MKKTGSIMEREQQQHHWKSQDNSKMRRRPFAAPVSFHRQVLARALAVALALCLQQQVAKSAPRQIQHASSSNQQQQATSGQQVSSSSGAGYFGSPIGSLLRHSHNISGTVYAVDEQTLFIRAFNFDGLATDAYFWSGAAPSGPQQEGGFIVPDEKGSTKPLERYQDKDLVLRLPEGKTLREIAWLSVWSRQTRQNLAHIAVPAGQATPRPLEIAPFSQLAHQLRSGPITIVDAQTFLVADFHYDGLGPAAYFWLTRGGSGLSQSGLRLKDENGSSAPLRKYAGETVVISLPDELTVYDFDYFGVWCTEFQVNFGQTRIPKLAKVPPSPKMLGIKPENKLNCEILYDELGYEIRWVLDGDDIVMQLVGKIEPNEYMAFGLGKDDSRSDMERADAVVAWVERQSGQVHAVDYFLGGKQQCASVAPGASLDQASCPDTRLPGAGDSLTLLHGAIVNGYSMVTFKRPQLGVDEQYDQHVYSDGQQSVLWAIGSLNSRQEVGYHRLRAQQNMFIDFARNPQWNCPIPDLNASMGAAAAALPSVLGAASQLDPTVVAAGRAEPSSAATPSVANKEAAGWFVPAIVCPADRTFHAQIGPAASRAGGRAQVAWYINGLLLPELVVERGQSYRFVVEGGNDKSGLSRRHPLYLTDSPEGGFEFKTDEERTKERPLAGVALRPDGQLVPTAEGRLCEWRPTNQSQTADQFASFAAYQRSLRLDCQPGQPAALKFSPDSHTPDLLYYQCYTNRFMGWRLRVVDSCQAYLASLSRSSRALQPASNRRQPNQSKRDTRERRTTIGGLAMEPLTAMSETRFSVESAPPSSHQFVEYPENPQSSSLLGDMLTSLPPDALILNNSQLHQQQPLNLTSFEQILKLSPADLEFLPEGPSIQQQQQQQQLEPVEFQLQPEPNSLPLHLLASEYQRQPAGVKQQPAKVPKTLQSYMRRLASIYYPLSSMLTGGNSSASAGGQPAGKNSQKQQQQQQQQMASSEQSSTFSLASLVPKSKIDLSKAGISKKLNKLRFKSGRKYEPTQAASGQKQHSQPPTPANEFNYDIFNNQLAQLELQQKQYQALEMASWPPTTGVSDFISPEEQQAVEQSMSPQQMMFGNIMQQQPSNLQQQQHRPLRLSETPLGPPNQFGQQPYVIDYLSLMLNSSRPAPSEQQQMMVSQQQPQQQVIYQENAHRPQYPGPQQQLDYNRQQPQSQQQAVYITRLPIAHGSYQLPSRPIYLNEVQRQPSSNWQESQAARYPNIQPYNGIRQQQQQQPVESSNYRNVHLTTMPSISQTTHESQQADYQSMENPASNNQNEVESLSGSGSGAYYDFRQQPTPKDQGQADSDHMLAIERFSKQSSERRPPSIVHPITGEQVLSLNMANQLQYWQQQQQQVAANSSTSAGNNQQPRRYSAILADKHLMNPSSESTPVLTGDLIDMDSLIQIGRAQPGSEFERYNQTEQPVSFNRQKATTEPSSTNGVLVKPESYLVPTGNDLLATTTSATTITSTAGPLIPSPGPPSSSLPAQNHYDNVYRSTLMEPVTNPSTPANTLLQNPSSQGHPIGQFNLDTNPFIPIELTNSNSYYPSNIQLRPSPFIENMISQHHSQFKPEPPVQVASYLAHHLAVHGPMVVSSERSVASSKPVALSISLPSQFDSSASSTNSTSHHNDLILLKPTASGHKQQAVQTYLLKPEYLTTSQAKGSDEHDLQRQNSELSHHQDQSYPARRLASHQFDRLSSLSSPPSTSIALDPLQASNSIVTSSYLLKHQTNSSLSEPATTTADHQQQLQRIELVMAKNTSATVQSSQDNLSQHRQSPLPTKSIPLTMNFQEIQPTSLSDSSATGQQEDGTRTTAGVNSSKVFDRDNSTDNAILSHVMSLISANAIPTPPLIPVGGYSRADYFLPISDRLQRSTRGST